MVTTAAGAAGPWLSGVWLGVWLEGSLTGTGMGIGAKTRAGAETGLARLGGGGMLSTGGTQHAIIDFVFDVRDHLLYNVVDVAADVTQEFFEACFHCHEVIA